MDNANFAVTFAERLLAAASSRERASEVVGDHLEQRRSTVSLWLSVLRLVFAMQWRWLVALPAAGLAIGIRVTPSMSARFAEGFADGRANASQAHAAVSLPQPVGMALTVTLCIAIIAMCLWSVSALSLVRYGLSSTVSRLSLMLAVLFTIGSCSMWAHNAIVIVPSALTFALVLALIDPQGRRALASIALAGGTFWGAVLLVTMLLARIVPIIGIKESAFIGNSGCVACLLVEACVLAQSRRLLRAA
jgi:hypothetical protein